LLPPDESAFAARLRGIRYLGVVCVLLKLARPISRYFWLNVNHPNARINGIVEYTNLNPIPEAAGHFAYVPHYTHTDSALYAGADENVFKETWLAVKHIAADLTDADLTGYRVFRDPYAQAICTTGFANAQLGRRAPIDGLFFADSTHLYPADRTQAGAIATACACAGQMSA